MVNGKKSTLLMAVMPNSYLNGADYFRVAGNYLYRAKVLANEGVDMKFLSPPDSSGFYGMFSLCGFLSEAAPERMVEVGPIKPDDFDYDDESETAYQRSLVWPRDIFQVFGSGVYSPFAQFRFAAQITKQLGIERKITFSDVGEGGFSVGVKNCRIASQIPHHPINWDEVRNEGYEVKEIVLDRKRYVNNPRLGGKFRQGVSHHMDLEIAGCLTPQGNPIILVNENFYESFKREIDGICSDLGARLVLVDRKSEIESRAVNLVNLPNGKVVVDSSAGKMRKKLEDNLGKDRVIAFDTLPWECWSEGGLRCRTNMVEY